MWLNLEHMLKAVPVLQEIDKAFLAQFNKYDPMMNQQTSLFMSMGMENPELMKAGFQNYHRVLGQFTVDMDDVIGKFINGNINFDQAVKTFKGFTGKHYKDMFQAGAQAVGNEFYDKLGMDKRSLSFINKARRAEMKFFKRFLHDIKNPLHKPVHPYLRAGKHPGRASFYANSAKAQFYNGMVAGAGSQMEIFWKLGVPQTEHCDICPVYAGHGAYTWQTLPTVPRGGDTPCLFRCYCHLEMRPRTGKMKGGDPDRMLQHGLRGTHPSPDRPQGAGNITDKRGRPVDVSDELYQRHDNLRGRLNQARQMIEATSGAERLKWIRLRKELNDMLIGLQNQYPDYKFLPTHAVKDLVSTVRSGMEKGELVRNISELQPGDEVIWMRGTQSGPGVVFRDEFGNLMVKFADGSTTFIYASEDVNFLVGGKGLQQKMANDAVKAFNSRASSAELARIMEKVDDWLAFSGPKGQANLDYISSKMGFPVTREYIQNFIAKQRQLVASGIPSTEAWATRDLFGNPMYNATRLEVHEKIIRKFLADGTVGNEMLMTGGYSASGKSSILNKLYPDWKTKFVNINSDDIKVALARADGHQELMHMAGQYHAEATDVLHKLVRRAMVSGKNLMYDGTMRSYSKQMDWLKQFQDQGYKVTGIYADLPMELCQQRAVGRAMAGTDRRFVDPFLIQAQEGKCLETFKRMAEKFDDWFHYSTDVPPGTDPLLMSSKATAGMQTAIPGTSKFAGATSVVSIEPLGGGCNESWKVVLDNGQTCVYKPSAGEHQNLRRGISREYTRETIASEIEKYLKLGQVPETVILDIPLPANTSASSGKGAYLAWQEGTRGDMLTPEQYAMIPLKEKQKLVLMDLVAQQTDRHMKNWLFDIATKTVKAIDNGLCMPSVGGQFRLSFGSSVAGTTIPAEFKTALQGFLDAKPAFKVAVRQALGGVLQNEEAQAIERMFMRVQKLLAMDKFPDDLGRFDGSFTTLSTSYWDSD